MIEPDRSETVASCTLVAEKGFREIVSTALDHQPIQRSGNTVMGHKAGSRRQGVGGYRKKEQNESGANAGKPQERSLDDPQMLCATRVELLPSTMSEPCRSVCGDGPIACFAPKPNKCRADEKENQEECDRSEFDPDRIEIAFEPQRKYKSEEEECEF